MRSMARERTLGAKTVALVVVFVSSSILLLLAEMLSPLVRFGFGDASYLALISVRVIGAQMAGLAVWRRMMTPQRRPLITVGLMVYVLGVALSLLFDSALYTPLRLHVGLIHLGVAIASYDLLRVRGPGDET